MSFFGMWLWLTVGGVAYQAMTYQDWARAFDTSWDQGVAFLFAWLITSSKIFVTPHELNREAE